MAGKTLRPGLARTFADIVNRRWEILGSAWNRVSGAHMIERRKDIIRRYIYTNNDMAELDGKKSDINLICAGSTIITSMLLGPTAITTGKPAYLLFTLLSPLISNIYGLYKAGQTDLEWEWRNKSYTEDLNKKESRYPDLAV